MFKDELHPSDKGDVAQRKVQEILAKYPISTAKRTVAMALRKAKVLYPTSRRKLESILQEEFDKEIGTSAAAPPLPPIAAAIRLQQVLNGNPNVGGNVTDDDEEYSDEE